MLHSLVSEYLRKLTDAKPQVSAELFHRIKADKSAFQEFFFSYSDILAPNTIKSELSLLKIVNKVVHEDIDFMSVHFEKICKKFGSKAKDVMEGLMSMRTDLTKAQRKEVLDKFMLVLNSEVAQAQATPGAITAAQAAQQGVNIGPAFSPVKSSSNNKSGEEKSTISSFLASIKAKAKFQAKTKPSERFNASSTSSSSSSTAGPNTTSSAKVKSVIDSDAVEVDMDDFLDDD